MVIFLPILAALMAFGVVTLLLAWLIFLIWIATEVFYARVVGDAVLVSELNYPRIHTLAEEVRARLSLKKQVSIFVYEQSDFNATLIRLFRRRAIFLQSEVLETGVSDDEVRWIVGRFVGFLRVQQDSGLIGWLLRIVERTGIFTLLIYPYDRAMVYTGDRLGLAVIGGDISAAVSAMQKVLVGRQLGYSVNPLGIIAQRRQTKGSIFAFMARFTSAFPSSTARYVDLISFAERRFPEAYARFEAITPGLPADLRSLSGEETSGRSVMMAIGAYLALTLGALLTAVWIGVVLNWISPAPAPYEYPEYATNEVIDANIVDDMTGPVDNAVDTNTVAAEPLVCTDQRDRHVTIRNQTSQDITYLAAWSVERRLWNGNVLMSGVLGSYSSSRFDWSDGSCECFYQFRAEFSDGSKVDSASVNVCGVSEVSVYSSSWETSTTVEGANTTSTNAM